MTGSFEVAVAADTDALEALAPSWWRLWRCCPEATPFTSPAWLLPWWHAFAPGPLRVVAVRRAGQLAALAPLYLEDGAFGRRLLPLGIGLSDGFDLLVDPDLPEAGPALAEAVGRLPGWDSLHLEELPEGAAALSLRWPAGFADEVTGQSARPVLDLPPGESAVPAPQRRKLRMARHRAARRGGRVELVPPDATDSFLCDLVRLHGARWSARGEAGVLADPRVRAFHAEALPRLVEAGLARLWRAVIADQVAGCFYGLQHGEVAYAYLGGFDPGFAFESPGTMLIGEAIEAAARDGATQFDFLRGQEAYKYGWGATDRFNRLRVVRRLDGAGG